VRKSMIVAVAVAVLMVAYFSRVWTTTADVQRQQGPAIIALVQQQFEPSPKLMEMQPVGDIVWVATPNAVDCKFQRPQIKNCWEVYFGTNVVGPDPNGRKPGKVEVNFIVDGDKMRLQGGVPPGGLLVRKGREAGGGAMGGEGGEQRGEKPDRPDSSQ
jgi:hypothetical protein